jgi:glycerol-3-phosphate acyltransferase PlsY
MAATAFGVSSAIIYPVPSIAIPALLAAGLIDWKHRANIKRLLKGEEPKLSLKKKKTT